MQTNRKEPWVPLPLGVKWIRRLSLVSRPVLATHAFSPSSKSPGERWFTTADPRPSGTIINFEANARNGEWVRHSEQY